TMTLTRIYTLALHDALPILDYHQNPAIQAVINQFKYKFNSQMADYLAVLMNDKLQQLFMTRKKPVLLIPIPLHSRRQRERGFNRSEEHTSELQSRENLVCRL